AGDFCKLVFTDLKGVLRFDLRGIEKIKSRTRLVNVGDGGSAQLEATLGSFELCFDGAFLCLDCAQRILCGKHIEVGLRDAQDEVLVRLLQGQVGRVCDVF